MEKNIHDLVVIGGGPAGMMMAAVASQNGASVILLEKNKSLAKKLKITGGGRCNITNAEFDVKKFLDNFPQAKKFLYSPFSKFSAQDTFDFFEKNGLPLKIEARKRAFPASDKAKDVFKALEKILIKNKVEIKTDAEVKRLISDNNEITEVVLKNNDRITGHNFALATGGVAAPQTGSTGAGFKFLKKLGHSIKEPNPNVVPLKTDNEILHKISGATWSFAKISFIQDGKTKIKKVGKILFTHFGLSAPLILNSAYEVKELLKIGVVTAKIDLFPDTEENDLDRRLWRLFEKNLSKQLKNVLPKLLEKNFSQAILEHFPQELSNKKINDVSKEERKALTKKMKNLTMKITGTLGMEKAVITDGGIILEEVDFSNMTSKKYFNLYLLGDILNINRPSGGFSLQLCWTTAFVAAQDILKKIKK